MQQTTAETYQTNIDKYIVPYFTNTGITLTDMNYRDVKIITTITAKPYAQAA